MITLVCCDCETIITLSMGSMVSTDWWYENAPLAIDCPVCDGECYSE